MVPVPNQKNVSAKKMDYDLTDLTARSGHAMARMNMSVRMSNYYEYLLELGKCPMNERVRGYEQVRMC